MCGDSTWGEHVMALLDGVVLDCILTDPPYSSGGFQEGGRSRGSIGMRQTPSIVNDKLSSRGYMVLLKQMLMAVPEPKVIYLFTDWRMWCWTYDVAEGSGYGVRAMIVWDKGHIGLGSGWRTQHELILCAAREPGAWKDYPSGQGNVITLPREKAASHYTQKPLKLIETLLTATPFVESVYDPFSGSGTTIIAAERQGRTCYAMEIEPRYVDMAVARWEQYTGGKAELQE